MRCILISDLVLYAGKSIYCTHREKGKCILSQAMLEWMQYSFHHFLHRGVFTHSPPCRTLGDTGDATMPPPRPLPSGAPSPSLPPASAPRWRRPPTAKRYRGRLPLVVALVAAWLGWGRQWQLVMQASRGSGPGDVVVGMCGARQFPAPWQRRGHGSGVRAQIRWDRRRPRWTRPGRGSFGWRLRIYDGGGV